MLNFYLSWTGELIFDGYILQSTLEFSTHMNFCKTFDDIGIL